MFKPKITKKDIGELGFVTSEEVRAIARDELISVHKDIASMKGSLTEIATNGRRSLIAIISFFSTIFVGMLGFLGTAIFKKLFE